MSKYYKMSDFEINKAIAEWFGFSYFGFYEQNGIMVRCNRLGGDTVTLDYCNNPADMWPIILENNIVVTPCMGANTGDATGYSEHQNPVISEFNDNSKALRAAAIVFLMVMEAGK